MKWIIISVVAVTLIILLLPAPEPIERKPLGVSYTNVTYFDGEQWHENAVLSIRDGRVVAGNDNSLQQVDMSGKYIIPGLIDAHTHTWGDALDQALRFGVTTELDMFTEVSFLQQQQRHRDSLQYTSAADLFSAGTLITSDGGHGSQYAVRIPTIENAAQAEAFVHARIEEGSDFIKIVYNRNPVYGPYTTISHDTMAATIRAAHKFGKLAVVHVSNHDSALDAVNAGANGLVHTFGDKLASDELLQAMLDNQVFVIPTLSVIASMTNAGANQSLLESKMLAEHFNAGSRAALQQSINASFVRPDYYTNAMANTRLMNDKGIVVLAGTDAPNPGTTHGVSMHGEVMLLVASGLSIDDALRAATSNAYSVFGIGERGHLKPGARADLLVLDLDPREDITHTQSFSHVIKNGFLVEAKQETTGQIVTLSDEGVISQFEHDLSVLNGDEFVATSDQIAGGTSTANIEWQAQGCETPGSLHASGEIQSGFAAPWGGAYLALTDNYQQGVNLTEYSRLAFNSFGEPGQYAVMFFTPESVRPYMVAFNVAANCARVQIDFAQHTAVDWANVSGIAWVAGQSSGEFTLAIDDIVIEN